MFAVESVLELEIKITTLKNTLAIVEEESRQFSEIDV